MNCFYCTKPILEGQSRTIAWVPEEETTKTVHRKCRNKARGLPKHKHIKAPLISL